MKHQINLLPFTACSLVYHLSILALFCFTAHPSIFTAAQSFSYEELLNTSVVNCTATLPANAVAYMTSFAAAYPNATQVVRLYCCFTLFNDVYIVCM